MATGGGEDEEELISKGLYRLVSDIVGPEFIVKLRRERLKFIEWMEKNKDRDDITLLSGSRADGFEMKTSDLDTMYWSCYTVVVENYSQYMNYHPYFNTVLMTDYDFTSPRFALVKRITHDGLDNAITQSVVWKCSEQWVSSRKYMEYHLQRYPSPSAHGPCQSGQLLGKEYDNAWCLKCAFWPKQAASFISRMRRCGWPPEGVIQDIIKDGCLLVSVASKQPQFEGASDLEWRISFSLAEKRLVYSMNHCQFLCYGLWKLFLSEVLKKLEGVEDLLCSYFLKTVVFWEIYKDPSCWTPSNFISKFYQTLLLLAGFVNEGNCPHFFIPDNNMFYRKVYGTNQRILLSYLRSFIKEGFFCLLKCESLQSKLWSLILNRNVVRDIPTEESVYLSMDALRAMTLKYICRCQVPLCDMKTSVCELCKLPSLYMDSRFSSIVLTIRKRRLHQNIAERTLHNIIQSRQSTTGNRTFLKYSRFAINSLQKNKTYLGYGELILAKSFYLLGDYRKTIKVANVVKSKLHANIMYEWAITEERVNRIQTRDLTYPQIIEQYIAVKFELFEETTLSELYPETLACRESTGATGLFIPPLVLTNFLLFLCHHKMNDVIQMYDVLRELHAVVHYDDNFHIKYTHRAISWEILGICQQLCEEYQAAYNSYINALNDRYNEFKNASIARINSVCFP